MTKEYYIEQIQIAGQYLIDNAEAILDNMDVTRIANIHLLSSIEPDSLCTVTVQKEYIPVQVGKEKNNG